MKTDPLERVSEHCPAALEAGEVAVFEAVAVAFEGEDLGVVNEAGTPRLIASLLQAAAAGEPGTSSVDNGDGTTTVQGSASPAHAPTFDVRIVIDNGTLLLRSLERLNDREDASVAPAMRDTFSVAEYVDADAAPAGVLDPLVAVTAAPDQPRDADTPVGVDARTHVADCDGRVMHLGKRLGDRLDRSPGVGCGERRREVGHSGPASFEVAMKRRGICDSGGVGGCRTWRPVSSPILRASVRVAFKALLKHIRRGRHRGARDRDVRSVVLTGDGHGFSAGGDIAMMRRAVGSLRAEEPAGAADIWRWIRNEFGGIARLIARTDKAFIAALNGPAAGVGLAWALTCDIAIASEDAVLVPAFGRIGLLPEVGTSCPLTRRLGYQGAFAF